MTLPQVFPLVAGEDEDDIKSIRSHRIKMEISGHSLEESMEECRVEEVSVHKVRGSISFTDSCLHPTSSSFYTHPATELRISENIYSIVVQKETSNNLTLTTLHKQDIIILFDYTD